MINRRRSRRPIYWLLSISLVLAIGASAYYFFKPSTPSKTYTVTNTKASTTPVSKPQNPNINVLGAGDFLAHDTVNQAALQSDGTYNYMPIMQQFVPIFDAADIRFCNDAQLNGGAQFGISGYPLFNSPPEFAQDMAKVGCNMVNDGTNHTFDRTQAAINATVNTWDAVPNMLAVVGENQNQAQHDAVHYFTTKGVKFAFLAYTTYLNTDAPAQDSYGVNLFSQSFASSQIATAKQNGAKFIIVSMRWGTEYSPTVNSEQTEDAQWLADQGVNLIFGHGSHVLQPVQWLTGSGGNKTLVWYSLGDFIGTQIPANTLFNGLAAMTIDPKTLAISNISFLPLYMHYEWTAAQAVEQSNSDLLARHNLKMYFFDQVSQSMIDAQQLNTTVAAQTQRIQSTLNTYMSVNLINEQQYTKQF